MIAPTVGRRVWYWPSASDQAGGFETDPEMVSLDRSQPFDAGIVFVHGEDVVNLVVTDHQGKVSARENVLLFQADQPVVPAGKYGHAQWMPYQAAQAKKNEGEPKPSLYPYPAFPSSKG